MNFIKDLFNKKNSEEAHLQFQKFSRGEFKNRALIKIKKIKDKTLISTTSEFANEFVKTFAEKIKNEKVNVSGAVISTLELDKEIKFDGKKQFMGVKQYLLNREMEGKEILELIQKMPKAFFALSFNSKNGDSLKIKPKAPKSSKPKNKEETPKPDFCKFITNDKEVIDEFIFETEKFKEAEISHDFIIEEIIIPQELKNEKDFAVIREKSLRKGKIIRRAVIDGKKSVIEINFQI